MEWKYPPPSLWQFLFDESLQWSFPFVLCVSSCFVNALLLYERHSIFFKFLCWEPIVLE